MATIILSGTAGQNGFGRIGNPIERDVGAIILSVLQGASSSQSPTRVVYDANNGSLYSLTATGSFTGYDSSGDPTGGTITDFSLTPSINYTPLSSNINFSVSGLSINVADLFNLVLNPTPDAVIQLNFLIFGGNDIFTGSDAHEDISGLGGNDVINANGGNDRISGGSGNDTLNGGDGNDTILDGSGDDILNGGDGADYFIVSSGVNIINGGAGDDYAQLDLFDLSARQWLLSDFQGRSIIDFPNGNRLTNVELFSLGLSDGNDTFTMDVIPIYSNNNSTAPKSHSVDARGGIDTFIADFSSSSTSISLNGQADVVWNLGTNIAQGLSIGTLYYGSIFGFEIFRVIGSQLADNLAGTVGDDTISAAGGADFLSGGDGNDILNGGAGADRLDGGNGSDTASFSGASSGVYLIAGDGASTAGEAVGDTFFSIENITGSAFSDLLSWDNNANVISGLAGQDQLFGLGGNDTLLGGTEDDVLTGGQGGDVLNGETGIDTASYASAAAGIYLYQGDNGNWTGDAAGDTLISIERVDGSNFNDIIGLSDLADEVRGLSGNDQLFGLGGNDILIGGIGRDVLNGGTGTDTASYSTAAAGVYAFAGDWGNFTGDAAGDTFTSIENLTGSAFNDILGMDGGNNVIDGGAGDDVLFGQGGGDTLIGGAGFDTASYATATSGIYAFIGDWGSFTGDARGDVFNSIEAIIGTNFNDVIGMDDNANRLVGGGGDDVLYGEGGGDQLFGNDGFDTVSYALAPSGVYVFLTDLGNATGDAAGDSFFSSIESIVGSNFDDIIGMGNFNDMLVGGGGNDVLHGLGGGDKFFGNDGFDTVSYALAGSGVYVFLADLGNATGDAAGDQDFSSIESIVGSNFNDIIGMGNFADTIIAGSGNDILFGMGGNDNLWGGAGNDLFAYNGTGFGADTIRDFQDGLDRIDFSRMAGVNYASLAITSVTGGTQVALGTSTILLSGINTSQITAADFLFA